MAPEGHNRYPFERNYARNSVIIVALAVTTMLLLTFPNLNPILYEKTIIFSAIFAVTIFCIRFLPFRRTLQRLKTERGDVTTKIATPRNQAVKLVMVGGLLALFLLPIVSVRLIDAMLWLSALLGYAVGLNLGELAYYLFIRKFEKSIGLAIYTFDLEDPLTRKRTMGYRLEKIRT